MMGRGLSIDWTMHLGLLGQKPDKEIASMLGLKLATVKKARRRLGIAPAPSDRIKWDQHPLGVESDGLIASRLGINCTLVKSARLRRGISPLQRRCKQCDREFSPKGPGSYCDEHQRTSAQRQKENYAAHPEKRRMYSKRYRISHLATVRARFKQWRERNPRYLREWRNKNKDREAAYRDRYKDWRVSHYQQNRSRFLESAKARHLRISQESREYYTLQSLQQIKEKLNAE